MDASVADRLARLAADQGAAATAPPGPILCVAPAGSGKTTTLVARIAWLVDRGTEPATITAITFNRRAAEELDGRLTAALEPLGLPAGAVRVRTFHALGLEILKSAAVDVRIVDRAELLRELAPGISSATIGRLDTAFSRLKLDLRSDPAAVAADPDAGPVAAAWIAYERALAERDALDFDDLVLRALAVLERSPALLTRWRQSCAHLLVDEAQDLDRSQLELALLLAAPANRIFLVGDDDQSIYGWRLADVRRVLGLASSLPGLRRVDLVTNYRCPPPVVERAVRLVEHNRERFAKRILPGPRAAGRLVLAPDARDEVVRLRAVLRSWPEDETTRAVLARTNADLWPAAAAALELGVPFRAPGVTLLVESPHLDGLLAAAGRMDADLPLLVRLARVRATLSTEPRAPHDAPGSDGEEASRMEVATAALAWAAGYRTLEEFGDGINAARARLAQLRRDDAPLTLATAHGTKGLEWDHVAVIGLEAGRFPSRRSVASSPEPERALEEERRLAYVAWTRARRTLTLLYDPSAPSRFLLEAFSPEELGIEQAPAA